MDGRAVSMRKGRVLPVSVKVTSVNERALVSSSILGVKKLVDHFENYIAVNTLRVCHCLWLCSMHGAQ